MPAGAPWTLARSIDCKQLLQQGGPKAGPSTQPLRERQPALADFLQGVLEARVESRMTLAEMRDWLAGKAAQLRAGTWSDA